MISFSVEKGKIGCNKSCISGYLIQTTDEDSQTRVLLSKQQLVDFIERLYKLMDEPQASNLNPSYIGLDLVGVEITEKSFYEFLNANAKVLTSASPQQLEKLSQDMEYLAKKLKEDFRVYQIH